MPKTAVIILKQISSGTIDTKVLNLCVVKSQKIEKAMLVSSANGKHMLKRAI